MVTGEPFFGRCDTVTLLNICGMTFCFSFEVLVTLNPIHVDTKGGGPTY